MFTDHNSVQRSVWQTTPESPERWLERLQRLKRDARLLEQFGTLPQSGRQMRAEPPDRWQVRLALLKNNPRLLERFSAFQRQLAALPRRARRWLIRKAALTLTAAALLLALSGAPLAYAAGSITVTTTDPNIVADGQCSLIEAIDNANADAQTHADCPAGSGADTIFLPADTTITLTSVNSVGSMYGTYGVNGLPKITSDITIEGNDATILRHSSAPEFRIFEVVRSDLTLNDTTVSGGRLTGPQASGGGIGVYYGGVTLNNSTVSGNSVDNEGGGIKVYHGGATLNNSTVSGNSANSGGGGGGLAGTGVMTLNNSTISNNSGGGIYVEFDATVTLNNSTVSGNSGGRGGGINNNLARLTLNNSTVSNNSATGAAGGIWNRWGTLTLEHSLISGNTAPNASEIENYPSGYGTGTIIADNYNLIGHDGDAGTFGFTPSGSDIVPSQPLSAILGPLADNGGPTLTHALIPGSPAVDAAPSGPATDQRGVSRPQGAAFDVGAFELEQQPIYNFSGFFQPVDNLPTLNSVKAGAGVPVKFSLGGDQGLAILAAGYPISEQIACEGGMPLDTIEQTVTAGGSSLSYDPLTDTYIYVWKTDSAWKGTCRQLIVRLADGTDHVANFKFK